MEYEILFINISRDLRGYSEGFRDSIGQYLLAAYLRERSFQAYVYSGNIADCKKVMEEEIKDHQVPVIGFYAAADNIRIVKNAVTWIKKNFETVITVIGGPQAIGLDYAFFEETGNDYAIIGEGEIPMYMLLSSIIDKTCSIQEVPSVVYADWKQKRLNINSCDSAVIQDLDTIPYPNLLDSLKGDLRQGKMAGLITGRGCPYQCAFCYEGANAKNVRLRSIGNVMREIDYIQEHNRHLEYLNIYDDTFTLKKERVEQFCNEIKKRKLNWFCEGHITFVLKNPNTVRYMVESGLTCIQFGIESGSNRVLEAYNKHTSFDMILEAIQICKAAGVHGITGNFIIGGAFESRETLEESKRLAKALIESAKGIIELCTVYFAPYPNTRIVNEPERFKITRKEELEAYNLNTMKSPVVETKELNTEEIYDLKQEFDAYMAECFRNAAKNPRKEDVLQGLFQDGKRIHVNPTWERNYLSQMYIETFLEHLSRQEQEFCETSYIIRTFEDFVPCGDKILSEAGEFYGLEKDILIRAVGNYTAREMAELFHKDIAEIGKAYEKLNQRCLVYMSEF